MSNGLNLTPKQMELLRHGAVLTGDTYSVRDKLGRFSKDQVFYFPKGKGGDNRWYVDVRVVEHVAKFAGVGYDLGRTKVGVKTLRFDCMDELTKQTYDIRRDQDWNAIHATKPGSNTKDPRRSNDRLMCPEDACGIKLATSMGSKKRSLRRKPGEPECTKCGKISTPAEPRPSGAPYAERHRTTPGAIPRNAGTDFVRPPAPAPQPHSGYGAASHSSGADSRTGSAPEPESQPPPPPVVPPQPEREPAPAPPDRAEAPDAPGPGHPDLIQDVEPPAEDKPAGRRELSRKVLVLGALVLIALMLVLWMFFQ